MQACELEQYPQTKLDQYPQTIAQKFRLLMTAGQTFKHQGEKRSEFYSAVVKYANELLQSAISSALGSSTRPVTPPAPDNKSKWSQQPDSPCRLREMANIVILEGQRSA